MRYNDALRARFFAPQHVDGNDPIWSTKNVAIGTAKSAAYNDEVSFALLTDGKTITKAVAKVCGSPHLVAIADLACERVMHSQTEQNECDIMTDNPAFSVPIERQYLALLAQKALKNALAETQGNPA